MSASELQFLAGGGESGARLREIDWARSPLGAPASWPPALQKLVARMLASTQPMFVAWGPARTLLYNDHYAPCLGRKHPDALGRDLLLEVWPEARDTLGPLVEAALDGEPVHAPRMPLMLERQAELQACHFSFSLSPVHDASGAVGGLSGACEDVTAKVAAERGQAECDVRLRQVLANMGQAFALFDRDFRVIEVNAGAERLVGMGRDELIGRVHWDLFPDTVDSALGTLYRRVMAEGQPGCIDHAHTLPGGRQVWFEVRAYPVDDGMGVLVHDITRQRREAEAAALAAERVQLALDAGAIVATWIWLIEEDRIMGDERFARLFDLDEQRARHGVPLGEAFEAIHPDDRTRVQAAVSEALQRGGPYRCEYRVRRGDGSHAWVEANGRVQLDADGRATRFPGVLLDHAERHRVEAERDRANALLHTFIDAMPGVVYAKDREGRLIIGNRGVSDLLGVGPNGFVGRTDLELIADPLQAAAVMTTDRRIMESGKAEQVEEEIAQADGSHAIWLSTKAPLRDAGGAVVGLVGASLDITDRKRVDQALRLSEQRNALALEVAQLGTWSWDIVGSGIAFDARAARICAVDPARADYGIGHLARRVHAHDLPRVERALKAALAPEGDGVLSEEFRLVHPDGRVLWVMTRGQASFAAGAGERRATSMIGTVQDVTERQRMMETLQEADQRKDEFLAMLAHELRNPLAPIGTAAHLLRLAPGDPVRVDRAAEIISRQVGHMTGMVDDLLDVSRVTRGLVEFEREPVDVRGVIAAAIEQAEPVLQARQHRLVTESSGNAAIVLGDRKRLVQVVSNLLNNAAKFTAPGGTIRVEISASDAEVEIRVRDDGIGIDERLLTQVFDLFTQGERTPDRAQGGLGIGLALVRSIVLAHGGSVSVHSAGSGRGSTFAVVLPRAVQADPVAVDAAAAPALARPHSVLVVDDNRDAADTLASVLQLLGHDVAVATGGHEALALAATRPDWDAFILDIGMPDMTGHELASQLRQVPGGRRARLIAVTGYGQAHDRDMSREAGFDHHLVKPADIDAIQELLARPRP